LVELTVGESLMLSDFRFEVLEQSDRRIELVRVARVLSEPAQE